MNIREAILEEHTRAQSDLIAGFVGDSQKRFDELIACVLTNEEPLARRAAWTMGHCCETFPGLSIPHLTNLVNLISTEPVHCAITRNTLRILQTVDFPPNLTGSIYQLCFDRANDPDEMSAIRVYAITILTRICQEEPELVEEVALLIQHHFPHSSGGFKSRARHLLKELESISKTSHRN